MPQRSAGPQQQNNANHWPLPAMLGRPQLAVSELLAT
jgi:hypothetical protein